MKAPSFLAPSPVGISSFQQNIRRLTISRRLCHTGYLVPHCSLEGRGRRRVCEMGDPERLDLPHFGSSPFLFRLPLGHSFDLPSLLPLQTVLLYSLCLAIVPRLSGHSPFTCPLQLPRLPLTRRRGLGTVDRYF